MHPETGYIWLHQRMEPAMSTARRRQARKPKSRRKSERQRQQRAKGK